MLTRESWKKGVVYFQNGVSYKFFFYGRCIMLKGSLKPIPGGLCKVRFWAGEPFRPLFRSRKPHIEATNGKRHLIGR